ncbi:MAG TPA: serine/threonine-protein kinase [Gemmatimonadales bacterium]|jgi:serine/threonine-protein kinase
MDDQITLIRPEAPSKDSRPGSLSSLPPDLLEQIRGRVRLLALFLAIGFAVDPVVYFAVKGSAALAGVELPPDFAKRLPFQWANLGAMASSVLVWAVSRHRQMLPSRLLTLGLVYEVVICFVMAFGTIWEYYVVKGFLPSMTWVPAVVILFPVILPGPPRRMLVAAFLAAAMVPLSLGLLQYWGKVPVTGDDYGDAVVQGALAVALAYVGARVVYGLGREVARARELGSYRLEKRLGAGGMGEVWRARHRMLARPAAIKLIRPALAGDTRGVSQEAIERFEREAQAIARLRSPHTVEVFDFGIASDGAFYYAMELLDGINADTLIRQFGPVPAERAVFLLRQVCHSLSEADACGLVHRDIKPANIFLCRYGEDSDFVKVLDFGLVKAVQDGPDANPGLTRENTVYGTPAFMAPEQALGQADLDGRVDVYATGCVAYWLLTGQLVFTAETPMGLMVQHANAAPVPPSTRTELSIPPDLELLVLSCLAKDPAARPQSARELMDRLDALEGASDWSDKRARAWWDLHQPGRTASK